MLSSLYLRIRQRYADPIVTPQITAFWSEVDKFLNGTIIDNYCRNKIWYLTLLNT